MCAAVSSAVATDRLRRLDVLFAERVLGCKFRYDWTSGNYDFTDPEAHRIGGKVPLKPLDQCEPGCGCDSTAPHRDLLGESVEIARYTRSLDAAWEGVTALHFSDADFTLSSGWLCILGDDGRMATGHGVNPAEALVLACLRAVGVPESDLA